MGQDQNALYHEQDGNLVLFKRPRSPFYYCRVKLPTNGRWKKFSTKTEDFDKALEVARREFTSIQIKLEEGIVLESRRFRDVANLAIQEMQEQLDVHQGKVTYHDYIRLIKLMIDFFGNKYISRITHADIHEFLKTRTEKNGRKLGKSTINNYNASLARVYEVALRNGWVQQNQIYKFKNDGRKTEARPYFTDDEVEALKKFMVEYSKRTTAGGVTWKTVEIRKLLRDYVEFILGTGMRPGTEVEQLKWSHIRIDEKNGKEYFRITIPKAKTKKREIVAQFGIQECLDRLARRFGERNRPDPEVIDEDALPEFSVKDLIGADEYIFRLSDGTFPVDLSGAFDILLDQAKLTLDAHGKKRTLYSLRHTYATQRLVERVDIHTLARAMGTSVKMLEDHYSHLDVWKHAELLSGDGEINREILDRNVTELTKQALQTIRIVNKMKREIKALEDESMTT